MSTESKSGNKTGPRRDVQWVPLAQRTVSLLSAPILIAVVAYLIYRDPPAALEYLRYHLGWALWALALVVFVIRWTLERRRRITAPDAPSSKGRGSRPRRSKSYKNPMPPITRIIPQWVDVTVFKDAIGWRLVYATTTGFAIYLCATTSVDVTAKPFPVHDIILAVTGPILWFVVLAIRLGSVERQRQDSIETIYGSAAVPFKYPPRDRKASALSNSDRDLRNSACIAVHEWDTVTMPRTFFVPTSTSVNANDEKAWNDFEANLDERLPKPEGWHVRRSNNRGRGALVGPANYPRSVLWDGEYNPDPLTFTLGPDLETGEPYVFTFNDTSPHMAASGGTSSGKTSAAEIIVAQALVTPMPWDPTLFGQAHFVDPKGPLARRWQGRPGVVVSNGQADSEVDPPVTDDNGDEICPFTGIMVMGKHMDYIEAEHKRRADILARYPDVGTWIALPDDVKRDEKLFPIFVVLDEYIDHTDLEKVKDEGRIEAEDAARQATTRMAAWHARKYRNVGMHTILIAQEVKMTGIGSNLMRNLPIRLITGQMDRTQIETMFGTTEVPRLPSSYRNDNGEIKTIPGRARIMNALGQSIHKIQVMWFGGPSNSDTLDKWLPRGSKPPNGDFSLPTGTRPRTAADFDDKGEFVGDGVDVIEHADAESGDEVELTTVPEESESVVEPATAPRTVTSPPASSPTSLDEPTEASESESSATSNTAEPQPAPAEDSRMLKVMADIREVDADISKYNRQAEAEVARGLSDAHGQKMDELFAKRRQLAVTLEKLRNEPAAAKSRKPARNATEKEPTAPQGKQIGYEVADADNLFT